MAPSLGSCNASLKVMSALHYRCQPALDTQNETPFYPLQPENNSSFIHFNHKTVKSEARVAKQRLTNDLIYYSIECVMKAFVYTIAEMVCENEDD